MEGKREEEEEREKTKYGGARVRDSMNACRESGEREEEGKERKKQREGEGQKKQKG